MSRSCGISILAIFLIMSFFSTPAEVGAKDNSWFKYQSPVPGARLVSPGTRLILRPGPALESLPGIGARDLERLIAVSGSMSGVARGSWTLASDGTTMTFKPMREFAAGEEVTVLLKDPADETQVLYSSRFNIKARIPEYRIDLDWQSGLDGTSDASADYPEEESSSGDLDESGKWGRKKWWKKRDGEQLVLPADFPVADITISGETARGSLFVTNNPGKGGTMGKYLMILDDSGYPEFFRKMPGQVLDFKVQPHRTLSYFHGQTNHFYRMDDTYTVIDSFTTEGYPVDAHDIVLTPEGHVLLIGNDPNIVDMSGLVDGGDSLANVTGNVIQEFDPAGNLVFEWRTIDHFDILDANIDLTKTNIRYAHINAVEVDFDGNILISSRHQSEITKIDRETGEMIWRMGGANNQFDLVGDTQWFSRQHDIRRLPNGHVTLFDNGNLNDPQESRGVEYELDEVNMVATLVWEYRNDIPVYGSSRGSTRRLANGNTIIGWGSGRPSGTEVAFDGTKVMEMELPPKNISYRIFRFPWKGQAAIPELWIEEGENKITLWFKRFGAEDVKQYYLYGGDQPDPTRRTGVSTGNSIDVHELVSGTTYYFRVTSVDCRGVESDFSEQVSYTPEFTDTHVIHDCVLKVTPRELDVESNGRWISAHISFPDESGLNLADLDLETVMLSGNLLVDWMPKKWGWGKEGPAECEDNDSDYDVKCGKKQLTLKFSREEFIDLFGADIGQVPVMIRGVVGEDSFLGYDTICVYQGDDSTCWCDDEDDEGDEPDDGDEDGDDPDIDDPAVDDPNDEIKPETLVVHQNYPNPFNPVTTIRFDLPARVHVNLSVYDINGRLVATLADRVIDAGNREVSWNGLNNNGDSVVSGIYFYKLSTDEKTVTKKMVLLR